MSYLPTPKSRQPKPPRVKVPRMPKVSPREAVTSRWGLAVLAAAFVAALAALAYFAFTLVHNTVAAGGGLGSVFAPVQGSLTALPPGVTAPPGLLEGPTPKPWNGVERVTLLIMGLDYRDTQADEGPPRTDTMMLVSLDPVGMTAGILSIPRDLWVEIPGFGYDKINKAYFDAESYRLPGGGPALAMQTVQNLLGVPIDYYAVVDFNSFTTLVDQIGGIDVDVPDEKIKIDPIGPGNTLKLHKGMNHLDGAGALAYARARNTTGGDFDRARRQQQVIYAIRDKVLNLQMLPTLIAKAPALYKTAASGLRTNLTLEQAISLAWTAKDIPRENIHNGIISTDQLSAITTIDGLDVLIPDPDKVRALREQVFTSAGAPGPVQTAVDVSQLAPREGAKIEILNGSGVPGLAASTKDYLVRKGLADTNIAVGSAAAYYPATTVIDFSGMPYTVRYLVELMKISPSNTLSQVKLDKGVDVQLILGGDWKVPQQ